MKIEDILEHFGVSEKRSADKIHIISHPDRLAQMDSFIFGMVDKTQKTRIIVEYDPGFPYSIIQVVPAEVPSRRSHLAE
ncbi:hypothetical protein [Intestinibacillus massiliensis]|uniref:hypothetical protein n=1 Tax=Intestinibacillus massiliensis TaxID=1871029 RepID=UPI000B34E042|nr:hypothetical protein [Intestinibacillus massiliensis]